MFHIINSWLAHLARRIYDQRLARTQAIAAASGWQAQRVAATTYRYRDPRFDQMPETGRAEYEHEDGELESRIASVRRTQEAWWL